MFDKLVESSREKTGRRTGRYFAIACVIYFVALAALCVGTIVTFSPVLAEEYNLTVFLPQPPPQGPPPMTAPIQRAAATQPDPGLVVPRELPAEIPPASDVTPKIPNYSPFVLVDGLEDGRGNNPNGIPGAPKVVEPVPPPPPVSKPSPRPEPTPAPEKPQTQKVSEGVLLGKVLHRVKPAYPNIAKAIRASGPVQVQVTISEAGRVIEAVVISGNPTLRDAARDAARQWIFSPTTLSNVPVKVQGILTFNFTLN